MRFEKNFFLICHEQGFSFDDIQRLRKSFKSKVNHEILELFHGLMVEIKCINRRFPVCSKRKRKKFW